MADVFDKKTRSKNMSRIRSKDTKPEMLIRRALHKRGFRYRLHCGDLPGKPDIVLPKLNAIIEVRGCFWHGHSCKLFKWPRTRAEFWKNKITENIRRDKKNLEQLVGDGWRVKIVWECSIKGKNPVEISKLIDELILWLTETTIIHP